jgi:class 3 adenylate cyclase
MKQGIIDKVKGIIDGGFEVEDISYVPDLENSKLTFGNKGLRFEATTLFIDMRGSTDVLNQHNRASMAKIYMCYFHAIVTIARGLGGEVRSFNGDGMLVFFPGTTKDTLSNAVKAAMKMKYMLAVDDGGIRKKMDTYSAPDFGIGIDDGKILCTKVGISGSNNRDLVWVGNAVNKAVKIGDKQESPRHIGISSYVYNNLNDEVKFHQREYALGGGTTKVDMWQPVHSGLNYNGSYETYYNTDYWWTIE